MRINCHITKDCPACPITGRKAGLFIKKIEKAVKTRKKMELSLVFTGDREIKELNRRYRKKNAVTDVLSFLYEKENGEVIISCPQAVKQAKKAGISAEEEMERLIGHGILHLLGYDHLREKDRKKMQKMENKILYV